MEEDAKISWTEEKTNESVRMEIGIEEDETLQQTVIRRKLGFFGQVMQSDGLEKGMMIHFTLASKLFSLAVQGSGALLSNLEGALYK